MKRWARIFILLLLATITAKAQDEILLNGLKKITKDSTISRHFGTIYYGLTAEMLEEIEHYPDTTKRFLGVFAREFGNLFIQAHENYLNGAEQEFPWQRYYQHTDLEPLQYAFMGMNAHINGDMWQALVNGNPYDSIKKYRHTMQSLKPVFDRYFDSVYNASLSIPRIRNIHRFSLGLDKVYAKGMIKQWRERQLKMAEYYYRNPKKFRKKQRQIHKKMLKRDKQALRFMK